METWGTVGQQDIAYPTRAGPLSLVEVEDYDEKELGVRLKFRDASRPGATMDAYVYPITKVEATSLADVLEWEMVSVAREMEVVARRRGMRAGEASSFPFGPSTGEGPRGLGLVRRLSSTSNEYMSYAFVAVRDHRFFKVRLTLPTEELFSDELDYFRDVVDLLAPAVHLRPPFEVPGFVIKGYANLFLTPQHEVCNLVGWLVYGVEMKEQIERGNYLNTFDRELAARRRALEQWQEALDEGESCPSDVLEAMSAADGAGFLSEYVYTAYGRGSWPVPEGLDLASWKDWAESNLEEHDPVIEPGVAVDWADEESEETSSSP